MDPSVSVIHHATDGSREPAVTGSTGPPPVATIPSTIERIDIPRVTAGLRHMVGSAEPARVFSQLAQVCVPAVSDTCTLEIVEEGGHRYRIRQPAGNSWRWDELDPDVLVRAEFASDGAGGPGFSGTVVCMWLDGCRPSEADSALIGLMVDHTVALVEHERLAGRVDELQDAAGQTACCCRVTSG